MHLSGGQMRLEKLLAAVAPIGSCQKFRQIAVSLRESMYRHHTIWRFSPEFVPESLNIAIAIHQINNWKLTLKEVECSEDELLSMGLGCPGLALIDPCRHEVLVREH
jgi:hypothetical protein